MTVGNSSSRTLILDPSPNSPIKFHTRTITVTKDPPVDLGRSHSDRTQPTPTNGYFNTNHFELEGSHAQVRVSNNDVWIKDKNSKYGTFVGNENIGTKERKLRNGDIIRLGNNVAGGNAIVAKVYIGMPTVVLVPQDGCTTRFKGDRSVKVQPGKTVPIGAADVVKGDGGRISPLDKHATLEWRGGHFFIEDLSGDSTNGTVVNGIPIKKSIATELHHGDIVRLGSHVVKRDNQKKPIGAAPIIFKVSLQ